LNNPKRGRLASRLASPTTAAKKQCKGVEKPHKEAGEVAQGKENVRAHRQISQMGIVWALQEFRVG